MRYLLAFSLLMSCSLCFSQSLLVNGSFEEENICTEYGVNCSPEGWISSGDAFNIYMKDPRMAFKGSHSVAIEAGFSYKSYQRTFMRTKLVCGLRKGHQYR